MDKNARDVLILGLTTKGLGAFLIFLPNKMARGTQSLFEVGTVAPLPPLCYAPAYKLI